MARLEHKLRLSLGPVIASALEDPSVVEVLVNEDGFVRVERLGGPGIENSGVRLEAHEVRSILEVVATMLGTVVHDRQPILEGELPLDGSRIEGLVPPVVQAPVLSIRKRASLVYSLDHYVENARMTVHERLAIGEAVASRRNILVVGGTGSGKTTLVNAVIREIADQCPEDRLVILEDTRELQCSSRDFVQLRTSAEASMSQLLKATLRLRPTRILVGEVRGEEALTMMKAWNTGHPGGVCTVHANSAQAGLLRLQQMAAEGTHGWIPSEMVAEAIGTVVCVGRGPKGPVVREVCEMVGLTTQGFELRNVGGPRQPSGEVYG